MINDYESVVASRFDLLHARFKDAIEDGDRRLAGLLGALEPIAGRRILDIGCGKGRFARALHARGAAVIGLDISPAMLASARGIDRVRGSVCRLPFGTASFDGVVAVEVFEHLSPASIDVAFGEIRRVLKPGGRVAIIDKNACSWNAKRPWLPSVLVKWIDERRGLWMYARGGTVREHWFRAGGFKRRLARWFRPVRVDFLLSNAEEGRLLFRLVPATRLFVMWSARIPGGDS